MTSDLQRRAARRRQAAMDIPPDLSLLTRRTAHGTVRLVGAVTLGLAAEPDIDAARERDEQVQDIRVYQAVLDEEIIDYGL